MILALDAESRSEDEHAEKNLALIPCENLVCVRETRRLDRERGREERSIKGNEKTR
jgi:hypothetical protein